MTKYRIVQYFSIITASAVVLGGVLFLTGCQKPEGPQPPAEATPYESGRFLFGADLSYANQLVDRGGVFRENNEEKSPFAIFADNGTQIVRLRLWHTPAWTKELYGGETPMYNDLEDTKKAIRLAHEQGMKVLLNFHFSDRWADPGTQEPPDAWKEITSVDDLKDSVYNYTYKTLQRLEIEGLAPDIVQLGNEINCGMFFTNVPETFPACDVCDEKQWQRLGTVLNASIKAVRDISNTSSIKPLIAIHVDNPGTGTYWFNNFKYTALVTDYDILGFSYYPAWATDVPLNTLGAAIKTTKSAIGKDVMILETGYPWTTEFADSNDNFFSDTAPIIGYPYSVDGQLALMSELSRQVINGGGLGVVYWEPDWISTPDFITLWGVGSSYENSTFFDFEGNLHRSINYMKEDYSKR